MTEGYSSLLGLNRKELEEARLARIAAKRPMPTDESDSRPTKMMKTDDYAQRAGSADVYSKPMIATSNPSTIPTAIHESSVTTGAAYISSKSKLEFLDGVIKKTWAFGHERLNDIKVEEVLQKRELTTAIISSFSWDFDWLVTKFDLKATKFIFVVQARNQNERQGLEKRFEGLSSIRLCFPPMSGSPYACMHSKLMLLFYPNHLRVVVPTANFIGYDWGETGEMEDMIFLIDLPRLSDSKFGTANKTLNHFSKELMKYITAMGLPEDAKTGVLNFDFSKTNDMRFVHTIGGSFTGDAALTTGFPQLSESIRSLGLQTPFAEPLEVDMCASSIGALDRDQLDQFHRSLRGQLPVEKPATTSVKLPSKKGKQIQTTIDNLPKTEPTSITPPSNFRIVFPSIATIDASKAGRKRAGTLFFPIKYYEREAFPSDAVHEYISRRKGLLSHSKIIFARSPTNAFFYVGSHNLSQSAWGRRTYDKKEKQWKLTGSNWECGVVLPVRQGVEDFLKLQTEAIVDDANISTASEDSETESEPEADGRSQPATRRIRPTEVLPFDVFRGVIDCPFDWPPKKYGPEDKPWCASDAVE